MLKDFWIGLGTAAKAGLASGVVVLLLASITLGTWLLKADRDVLFAGLAPQDAAVMTAELDRMKVPYVLGADGTSILVDRATVHQTRLKLLGKDIPLRGAVGFELFNTSDFGMTEFSQKINYQRALQGEITRTILSLSEVESARVHLALPEEGLFRREQVRAKASVTLGLRRNQSLRPEQVSGIQRLISAAVPGVSAHDVTIVDTQGVALTRLSPSEPGFDTGSRLELQRDIEQHLVRKAEALLERTFGVGQAIASVDVSLNMDQVKTTTEDVTNPTPTKGETPTGVIVRERETSKEDGQVAARRDAPLVNVGSSHRETDYQVGRRVEQVVSQPGSIQRLQVLAVIKVSIDPKQLEHARDLLGAAVGLQPLRGDVIVVKSLGSLATAGPPPTTVLPSPSAAPASGVALDQPAAKSSGQLALPVSSDVLVVLAAVLAVVSMGSLLVRKWLPGKSAQAAEMSPLQRATALADVQRWLLDGAQAPGRHSMSPAPDSLARPNQRPPTPTPTSPTSASLSAASLFRPNHER